MLVYWLLFAYFAAGALLTRDDSKQSQISAYFLFCGLVGMILIIGLRFEVGGDWFAYKRIFSRTAFVGLDQSLTEGDPGYQLLNWLIRRMGAELWLVNLTCASIFGWGLWRLAKVQRDSWLTLLVAIPYLVIVVSMGYTRQAVAIGFIMAGLAAVRRGASPLRFTIYIIAAVLFHKTATVVIPLVLLASNRNTLINAIIGIALTFLLYDLFIAESTDIMVSNYLTDEYESEGAAIRVFMSVLPALLFFLLSRRLGLSEQDRLIARNFSLAAVALLALLFALPSSAAIDRLALYILPLQLVVLPRIPRAIGSLGIGRFAVVVYCFAVQFVWLNYATNAPAWVPYQFYPIAT